MEAVVAVEEFITVRLPETVSFRMASRVRTRTSSAVRAYSPAFPPDGIGGRQQRASRNHERGGRTVPAAPVLGADSQAGGMWFGRIRRFSDRLIRN